MKNLSLLLMMSFHLYGFGQSVGINENGAAAHSSSILDVSGNKGILIPRMSFEQRNNIPTPATGLLIYQNDNASGFYYFNGSTWQSLSDNMGNHTATQNIILGSRYISRSGAANIGLQFMADESMRYRAFNSMPGSPTLGDRFRLDNNGGLVALGELGVGTIPSTGEGTRMMWYPYKAAFRVGGVAGTEWDDSNTGFYSTAIGYNSSASAYGTFAGGEGSRASGVDAFAYGANCLASGNAGVGMGASTTAAGFTSLAVGFTTRALGDGSVALGYRCGAKNNYSVAIGYRAVANNTGAFVLADASTTDSLLSSANNQFNARYAGGYRLYTNSPKTVGVSIVAGGNAWASISDSSLKERFVPASSEMFLQKLTDLRMGSWNYKGQAGPEYRHYGPMAQEVFSAFGKDAYGTIGNDTTLNSADMDGLIMILLQGLEKRTKTLLQTNQKLNSEVDRLTTENKILQEKIAKIDQLQQQVTLLMDLAQKNENLTKDLVKSELK